MDLTSLESSLADLDLSAIRYYPSLDSTNDEAFRWIMMGATDRALVVADEQTAGRGRLNRHWVTAPAAGLAFSLILMSPPYDPQTASRLAGLGAVATRHVLEHRYALPSQIKWPNDVLLSGRKAAGVLAETSWEGDALRSAVIGIGINIASPSLEAAMSQLIGINFPITCVEDVAGHRVDRHELLHAVLKELLAWLPRLSSAEFLAEWEANLAYRDQRVELSYPGSAAPRSGSTDSPAIIQEGKLVGLAETGGLRLLTASGEVITVSDGELQLRPAHGSSLPIQLA